MQLMEKSSCENGKIHIYTVGKFQIHNTEYDEKHFHASSDKQCKLLEFMLINSNRGLSVENIIEILYPEN